MAWEGRMEVQIVNGEGQIIWARNPVGGLTSSAYGKSGMLREIEQSLQRALEQCRGELTVSDYADGVSDVGRPSA